MPLEVVTIGGSLAGLMVSIALRRLGSNVRILERAPTPLLHNQGAGIVAGGEIPDFLEQYDRTHTAIAVTSRQRLYFADKSGKHIQRDHTLQHMTSWDLLYHLCRANFDRKRSDYVKNADLTTDLPGEGTARYYYGCNVNSVEKEGSKVKISYRSTLPGDEGNELHYMTADFVVIADGASSVMRQLLCPSAPKRTYAGYVAIRGTVPESYLSPEASAVFVESFPFWSAPGTQILGYTIPGPAGTLQPGHRLINWVWYVNVEGSSDRYREFMTDSSGKSHRWTLPTGGHMRPDVWDAQRRSATENLPPQFAELVHKTEAPFVQAITDLEPPKDDKCWVLGGMGVIVGDALAGFRPHTAASTAQAALHARMLGMVFAGKMDREGYEDTVIRFARQTQMSGVRMGNRSQFGQHCV